MTKILVCDGMDKTVFENLQKVNGFDVFPTPKNDQETILKEVANAEGIVIRSATKVTKEFIEKAPNLKYVIRAGEGTDNIDKAFCQEKGIKVSNTPGANNNSAAEHAIALMMTLLRHTSAAQSSMANGKWEKSKFTGNELTNKTVGVIGFGRIGQLVAKRLQGFEPRILFFDKFIDQSPFDYAFKASSLEQIFTESDIITVHVPKLPDTTNLIDEKLFKLMKKSAIFVNAARGGIVVENDLIKALEAGNLAAAALDVFATEPLEENSSLRNTPNLILTPHLGGSTEEAQLRVGEMALEQLKSFFLEGNLQNEVRA